ncbi:MAG TPA: hypothetical protein VJU61_12910 [Polyangiaceae bacterium]|nr:hypothetical protein [Polyangiaceae bacterium]
MSSSFQTTPSVPSSRSTGFVAATEAISPEVRTFGAIFMVFWMLLLAFLFVLRRKQRVLRVEVERLEAALLPEADDEE